MTLDEEINIARCLDSVRWSNDVVILDSFSQDRTIERANAYPNVRIYQRKFDDFSRQRNYGIHQIQYVNSWLLVLDADEVVEPNLAKEIREVAGAGSQVSHDVFMLRRKVFINGRWVRWNMNYDFWLPRMIRPETVCFEGAVHEKLCFAGGYGFLKGAVEHHQFEKGLNDWLNRRARYARLETQKAATTESIPRLLLNLSRRNPLDRRAALKSLFFRLPGKYVVYFFYNIIFKFSYLDGIAGLSYVLLEAYSHYLAAKQIKSGHNVQHHQTDYSTALTASAHRADVLHD
jgi:glycosyltransferase involved in cell wall biosynthesis